MDISTHKMYDNSIINIYRVDIRTIIWKMMLLEGIHWLTYISLKATTKIKKVVITNLTSKEVKWKQAR